MTEDPNTPVVAISVPNDIEAAAIVAALGRNGIEAMATGEFTAGFRAEAPGAVQVMVKQADLEQARSLLDSFD